MGVGASGVLFYWSQARQKTITRNPRASTVKSSMNDMANDFNHYRTNVAPGPEKWTGCVTGGTNDSIWGIKISGVTLGPVT